MSQEKWWVLSDTAFISALRRAYCGEDPDLLFMEYLANSDVFAEDGSAPDITFTLDPDDDW